MKTLLLSIAAGIAALAVFGVVAVVGTAAAIQTTGEVVGIGALTDMTALAVAKAVKRKPRRSGPFQA